MSTSNSIYVIAYPDSGTASPVLNFTYNMTADYYPPGGMTVQLQAELAADVSRSTLWWALIIIGVLGAGVIVLVLMIICCKDFDPETDFEKRRRKLAKDRKKKEKQMQK